MPQEAWILKCCSCQKFQVQLKKKAKKWKCVVCGAKQDLMTIYFKGQPSDCRVNVQNMNAAQGESLERLAEKSIYEDQEVDYDEHGQIQCSFNNYNSFYNKQEFTENSIAEIDLVEESQSKTFDTQQYDLDHTEMPRYEQTSAFSDRSYSNCKEYIDNSAKLPLGEKKNDSMVNKEQKNQENRSSIFESNCDFNDELDF